jgi:site-specific recombinase XerD
MKFTSKYTQKDGATVIRFRPPKDAVDAGVAKPQTFYDGRVARYEIPRLIEKVEAFRRGEVVAQSLTPDSTLKVVFSYYCSTGHYKCLPEATQNVYRYRMKKLLSSSGGDVPIQKVTHQMCSEWYADWLTRHSVREANNTAKIVTILLNFAMHLDLIKDNPMMRVKKLRVRSSGHKTWTREQVDLLVSTAFSKFEWRNLGLLALMCYEWAQKVQDIASLEWSNLDLDKATVSITTINSGKHIILPIEEPLLTLLKDQKKDFDFQSLVVPYYRKPDRSYVRFTHIYISTTLAKIREACGLPKELQLNHLRGTAITEFIEAGADSMNILQVTGLKTVDTLNPYIVGNKDGAQKALNARKGLQE